MYYSCSHFAGFNWCRIVNFVMVVDHNSILIWNNFVYVKKCQLSEKVNLCCYLWQLFQELEIYNRFNFAKRKVSKLHHFSFLIYAKFACNWKHLEVIRHLKFWVQLKLISSFIFPPYRVHQNVMYLLKNLNPAGKKIYTWT